MRQNAQLKETTIRGLLYSVSLFRSSIGHSHFIDLLELYSKDTRISVRSYVSVIIAVILIQDVSEFDEAGLNCLRKILSKIIDGGIDAYTKPFLEKHFPDFFDS